MWHDATFVFAKLVLAVIIAILLVLFAMGAYKGIEPYRLFTLRERMHFASEIYYIFCVLLVGLGVAAVLFGLFWIGDN